MSGDYIANPLQRSPLALLNVAMPQITKGNAATSNLGMRELIESARRIREACQVTRQNARANVLYSRRISLDLQAGFHRLKAIQDKLIARNILPKASGSGRAA